MAKPLNFASDILCTVERLSLKEWLTLDYVPYRDFKR